jgi:hypothetical protein
LRTEDLPRLDLSKLTSDKSALHNGGNQATAPGLDRDEAGTIVLSESPH